MTLAQHREWLPLRPLDEVAPVAPLMNPDMFPPALREYVHDAATRMCAPLEFVGIPLVTSLGSLLGRQIAIRPKRQGDWYEVPNFWGAIVGPPGIKKSPAMNAGLFPFFKIADEIDLVNRERRQIFEQEHRLLESEAAGAKRRFERAMSAIKDRDILNLDEFRAEVESTQTKLADARFIERCIWTSDTSREKLGVLLEQNSNGVLIIRDELSGWIAVMDDSGHHGERGNFLETWSGQGRYRYDRIARGTVMVRAACTSIIGTIQSALFARYVIEARGSRADGLLPRFQLLVWPDSLPEYDRDAEEREANTQAKDRVCSLFRRAHSLEKVDLATSVEPGEVAFLRFSSQAQCEFDGWHEGLEKRLRSDEALLHDPALAAHLSKYRKTVPTLALIFHLTEVLNNERSAGPVSVEAFDLAIRWAKYLEQHVSKVYSGAHISVGTRRLVDKIESGVITDGIHVRDIYRNQWAGLKDVASVRAAARILEVANWLRFEDGPPDAAGRPSEVCRIHPALCRNGNSPD